MRTAVFVWVFIAFCEAAQAAPTAEELFNAGQSAYDEGNFMLAVERWQESFRLSREPAIYFNIGQAYRLAGDCERALTNYRRFIAADPTSERRAIADELVSELEQKCGTPAPNSPVAKTVERKATSRLRIAGLATSGAGGALTITGLLYGWRAASLGEEVSSACSVSCDWATWKDKDTRGRRYATIGYALDVAGIAAIAGGAVMYYLGRERAVSVVPSPNEDGAVISWSGSW